eukprot:UN28681
MSDPYILKMTETEPMTLHEVSDLVPFYNKCDDKYIFLLIDNELETLAGDINLFIYEETNEEDEKDKDVKEQEKYGELNIMVAEEKSRRKGIAKEAIQLIMKYGKENWASKSFKQK